MEIAEQIPSDLRGIYLEHIAAEMKAGHKAFHLGSFVPFGCRGF
jgi:hypothetical protein